MNGLELNCITKINIFFSKGHQHREATLIKTLEIPGLNKP